MFIPTCNMYAAVNDPSAKGSPNASPTPTAISHQIRLLEEICGCKLFQRRPRPLVLTGAGARLFPVLRNGFDLLAGSLAAMAEPDIQAPLRV
ncbi:MAG: LysR family transcriptional regulator, partial [Mesorhizobium sp.]